MDMKCPPQFIEKPEVSRIWKFAPEGFDVKSARRKIVEEYIPLLNDKYSNGHWAGIGYQTFYLVGELIRNAYYHGEGEKHEVTLGAFLSPDVAVVGCNDGGDYFTRPEIKDAWERRLKIPSSGLKLDENRKFLSGANIGRDWIYSRVDEIFIDTDSGTFFGKFDPFFYTKYSREEMEKIWERRITPIKKGI